MPGLKRIRSGMVERRFLFTGRTRHDRPHRMEDNGKQIMDKSKMRLLIFVVAYNASSTIKPLLERIPPAVFEYDYKVLIIDDSSADETFERSLDYQGLNPNLNLEVLYNPENQGYGGNQKLGYQYALEMGYDAVVLLHGDGQYAPELIEDLVLPVLTGEADAVFGSRMARPKDAIRGGMPFYKFLGNRVLTLVQNFLLKAKLTEFHSGYRVYSTAALREIPFQRNTNDFHFDTEIIIQFLRKGFRIKEVPIPTFYGDEVCHVNGFKYALDVASTTIVSRLHDMNIFYQRKYDVEAPEDVYDIKLGYMSSHTVTLDRIPPGSRVLDVGSGRGLMSEQLKHKDCYVHAVDILPPDKAVADRFTQADFDEQGWVVSPEGHDYVLLLDLVEHLKAPERFLDELRSKAGTPKPTVIITVPNVAYFITRFSLLFGNFRYGKRGILDLTHRRLFTFKTLLSLLEQSGFRVTNVQGLPAPFPKAVGRNSLGMGLLELNRLLIKLSRGLFSYQIYAEAVPLPTVDDLLAHSRTASESRTADYRSRAQSAAAGDR